MLSTLLTSCNLLLGFAAIMMMTLPQAVGWGGPRLEMAVWMIAIAGFLDAVDGPVARRGGRQPAPWGREFDSLADLVSFGVAPAVLIIAANPEELQFISILSGALFIMAGTWRLARFIWSGSKVPGGRFAGLPITGAGLAIAAFWLFENAIWGRMLHSAAAFVLVCVCSFLMISRMEYEKFPEFGLRERRNTVKWWIAAAAILFIIIKPTLTGFPVALLYLGHGPLRALTKSKLAGTLGRRGSNGGR